MHWTRRGLLAAGAASLLGPTVRALRAAGGARPRMGIVIHSYTIRHSLDKERRFEDPLTFLAHCQSLGAGGAQLSLGVRDDSYCDQVREFVAARGLFLEASIALPRDRGDLARFIAEMRTAKRCGVNVFRTVLMGGRRYEVFASAAAFRRFLEDGKERLALARAVVEHHEIRMAIENHKDLQAPELVELIKKLDSPWIGVCLDTGNNLALLESPQQTVDLLAPLAFTTHVKDMGVEEYPDGFLLAEVPLGTGFLDLPTIVATMRRGHPELRLNLEMITRDPLKIPCLTPGYWATLDNVPGRRLAEMISLVRAHAVSRPLLRISTLTKDQQLAREDDHVRQSLQYAHARLDA
jgi:sugar phosphate isomerase/epimerase